MEALVEFKLGFRRQRRRGLGSEILCAFVGRFRPGPVNPDRNNRRSPRAPSVLTAFIIALLDAVIRPFLLVASMLRITSL